MAKRAAKKRGKLGKLTRDLERRTQEALSAGCVFGAYAQGHVTLPQKPRTRIG
jgi:pantothenate kinase type III